MSLPPNTNNQFCSWADGDTVNADQMNNQTFDIYNKIAALTNNTLPCIISGGIVNNNGNGTISISSGFYRCQDSPSPLPVGTQGFFTVAASTSIDISTSLGYYIIARIVITNNPIYTNFFYNMGGEYDVIPVGSYQPNTDIILGSIDDNAAIVLCLLRNNDYNNLLKIISNQQYSIVSTNYDIQPTDSTLIVTSPNLTLQLPDLQTVTSAKQFTIIAHGISTITTIHDSNGYNIGPSTSFILEPWQTVDLIAYTGSTGTTVVDFWQPVASNYIAPNPYPSISNPNLQNFAVSVAASSPSGNIGTLFSGQDANGYVFNSFRVQNTANNNKSVIDQFYTNPGNGVYKPNAEITVEDIAGNTAALVMFPADSATNYHGFHTILYTENPSGQISELGLAMDINNLPYWDLNLSSSSTTNTGIKAIWNQRPILLGNLTTLGKSTASITAFMDFSGNLFAQTGSGNTNSYAFLPMLIGVTVYKFMVQWGKVQISSGFTSTTYNLPNAFPTQILSLTTGLANVGTTSSGVSIGNTSLDTIAISATSGSPVLSNTIVFYMILGY